MNGRWGGSAAGDLQERLRAHLLLLGGAVLGRVLLGLLETLLRVLDAALQIRRVEVVGEIASPTSTVTLLAKTSSQPSAEANRRPPSLESKSEASS